MTVKQLAAELNTSKTTIKNVMRRLNITPQKRMERGQEVIFLSEQEIEQIKERFLENHPAENSENFTGKVSGNTENFTANPTENSKNFTANTENTIENNISGQLVEILRQDLEIKNKQIEDLNNRLAEAMKALDQEQQLKALAEKKILELEDKAAAAAIRTTEEPVKVEEPEEPVKQKKGLFSWLKKKWQ